MKPSIGGAYRGRSISDPTRTVGGTLVGILRWPDGAPPWAVIRHVSGDFACEYHTLEREEEEPT